MSELNINLLFLDIKFRFTCNESNLHKNYVKFQNIVIRIVAANLTNLESVFAFNKTKSTLF